MKRIYLLVGLVLASSAVLVACAAASAPGSAAKPAAESAAGQNAGNLASVTFDVPTIL